MATSSKLTAVGGPSGCSTADVATGGSHRENDPSSSASAEANRGCARPTGTMRAGISTSSCARSRVLAPTGRRCTSTVALTPTYGTSGSVITNFRRHAHADVSRELLGRRTARPLSNEASTRPSAPCVAQRRGAVGGRELHLYPSHPTLAAGFSTATARDQYFDRIPAHSQGVERNVRIEPTSAHRANPESARPGDQEFDGCSPVRGHVKVPVRGHRKSPPR